jgi:Predicted oxidoreductases (related to aryl-alcohol dehydrogenases)
MEDNIDKSGFRNGSDNPPPNNRRDFLKNVALLGASACIPTAPLIQGCTETKKQSSDDNKNKMSKSNISQHRTLGKGAAAMEVTAMGFGAMNTVHAYGSPVPLDTAHKVIRHAYELGVNFFDTAEVYGPFTSEQRLGEAVQSVRKEIQIATKFGFEITEQGQVLGRNSRPEQIKKACEQSLRRLKTDYIDLFYQHRIDPNVPIEDVAGAVKDLIQEGKVKHFGLSAAGAATIRRAHAVQPLTAVQNHYSFWSRSPEQEVLAICEELGIGFVPWSPLGMGYLTGTVSAETAFMDDKEELRPHFPRFTVEARRANWPVINLLNRVGRPKGATCGQVALAWLLAQKPFIVPIPGTTKIAHLNENIGGLDVQLDEKDLLELNDGFAKIRVVGEYTAPDHMEQIDIGDRPGTSSAGGHGFSPLPNK